MRASGSSRTRLRTAAPAARSRLSSSCAGVTQMPGRLIGADILQHRRWQAPRVGEILRRDRRRGDPQARIERHRTDALDAGERLADDAAHETRHRRVRSARAHRHGGQAARDAVDEAAPGGLEDEQFRDGFRRAVGGRRTQRVILGHYRGQGAAEHGNRAREHESRWTRGSPARVEQRLRAADVDRHGEVGFCLGLATQDGGQVPDRRDVRRHGRPQTPASATLADHRHDARVLDGAGDLVDTDDARRRGTARAREQGLNETRAEEAGTAGDENGHRCGISCVKRPAHATVRAVMAPARIALVTGAGSGIGRAVAIGLLQAGYAVALVGRRAARSRRRSPRRARHGVPHWCCRPTSPNPTPSATSLPARAPRTAASTCCSTTPACRAPAVPLEDVTFDQWRAVVDVNLTGVFLCTQEAFRIMKAQVPRGGRIINNGSIAAHVPRPHCGSLRGDQARGHRAHPRDCARRSRLRHRLRADRHRQRRHRHGARLCARRPPAQRYDCRASLSSISLTSSMRCCTWPGCRWKPTCHSLQ